MVSAFVPLERCSSVLKAVLHLSCPDCTGPDDNHPRVNNNAYTLALASLAIHWARYYACLCQRIGREEVPDEWIQKALYLNLPFDNVRRYHMQHDGFDSSEFS